jgi:small subunit ribosomal protein S14
MAKESLKARQKKRLSLVLKYLKIRKKYKKLGDYISLQKLPKNSSPVRLRNLCSLTGRARGYMRLYGISRIKFRDLAANGYIPGVKKSSW